MNDRVFVPGQPWVFSKKRNRAWKIRTLTAFGVIDIKTVDVKEYTAVHQDPNIVEIEVLDFGLFKYKEERGGMKQNDREY